MSDVLFVSGKKVVNADNFVAEVEQLFAKMGAKKTGPASDEDVFVHCFPNVTGF